MASGKMLSALVVATALFGLAIATDHTIGGPSGWTMGSDLRTWSASQTFVVGDNLVFAYPSAFHDVVEVSKPEFDNCQAIKPLVTFSNGNTVVPLTSPGKRYFICGMPGHCTQGMKLEVNVLPTANAVTPLPNASPQPLPNAGNAILPPIASPPSTLLSVVSPQPLLPLNPAGVVPVPVLSPSSTPIPGASSSSSSLPLIPELSPRSSPAVTSLPSFPGSPSTTSSKTVGNFPSSTDLPPSADSSASPKTLVLGFGIAFVIMVIHLF
ncbi:PREDICTED: uclacyanin 1 [Tarenaya hassleriana]|uniref:uclacyanin 1 n=1 Tax=Tarenaya hassleriana TaxID=28532 RepID=UPI00053C43D2|nr:PREDICTED: uclacyanin 1 [Tarenaya hassleriana]